MPFEDLMILLGGVFLGNIISAIYRKLNGNGKTELDVRLGKIEVELEYIRKEIDEIKKIVNELCIGKSVGVRN